MFPSNSMNVLYAVDLPFVPSELLIYFAFEPKALPWAISFGPVGAKSRHNATSCEIAVRRT